MFGNILIVARGADADQPAVQRAVLCARPGARLVALDLVHEPMLDGYLGNTVIYEPLRARVVAERRVALEALAKTLCARGFDASGEAVWEYPLDEAVAKHARSERSDLVVLGPADAAVHGLTPSEWRLVTSCNAPVLVARGPATKAYRQDRGRRRSVSRALETRGLDLSIIDHARRLAEGQAARAGRRSLLHVAGVFRRRAGGRGARGDRRAPRSARAARRASRASEVRRAARGRRRAAYAAQANGRARRGRSHRDGRARARTVRGMAHRQHCRARAASARPPTCSP